MQENRLTGYPSIDKPWLKKYSKGLINQPLFNGSAYEYIWEQNNKNQSDIAIEFFGKKSHIKQCFQT